MRTVPFALAFCLSLWSTAALAEPLRFEARTDVPAPERPTLTLTAQEPVRDVQLELRPAAAPAGEPGAASPETAPLSLRVGALWAGARRTFPIGTGRIGKTAWSGTLRYQAGGQPSSSDLRIVTLVTPSMKLRYGVDHLDLKERHVEVQLSRPAARAEVRVIAEDGDEMGAGRVELGAAAPGTWLRVPWQEGRAANVLRVEVVVHDTAGFPARLMLWPWSVTVPHDEVRFATASFEIRPEERGKLDDSHRRIAAVLDKVKDKLAAPQAAKVFVAGHTDTVGSDGDNLTLSLNRARAIAAALRERGIAAPIFYAGLGERSLRVQTADNVDEERNRRADYVVAIEPPRLGGGASWQRLP